jgi:hypothetical protein
MTVVQSVDVRKHKPLVISQLISTEIEFVALYLQTLEQILLTDTTSKTQSNQQKENAV